MRVQFSFCIAFSLILSVDLILFLSSVNHVPGSELTTFQKIQDKLFRWLSQSTPHMMGPSAKCPRYSIYSRTHILAMWLCSSSHQWVEYTSPLSLADLTWVGRSNIGAFARLCVKRPCTFVLSHLGALSLLPCEEIWSNLLEDERPHGTQMSHLSWSPTSDQDQPSASDWTVECGSMSPDKSPTEDCPPECSPNRWTVELWANDDI